MSIKSVHQLFAPPPAHMVGDGFKVHSFFPGGYNLGTRRMSPFFLMDYNAKTLLPPSNQPRGVGVHPHRGFETVTIAYHGKVAHHDSAGNSGVIGEGDVQWMTAASGVLHKEYHEAEFSRTGGWFQMVQLWVNLPAKFKMTPPKYQAITNEQMGKYELPNQLGTVEVIAGEYQGVKGPAFTFTPIEMYNLRLKKGATLTLSLPETYNTGILVIEGSAQFNNSTLAPTDHFILFKNDGDQITIEATEDTVLLVLSGEPINEPVVGYGPFLMNNYDEINQAILDFNHGLFGHLED
ncbi:MAG: pirin family protein [Spirosomataceae bacterium]